MKTCTGCAEPAADDKDLCASCDWEIEKERALNSEEEDEDGACPECENTGSSQIDGENCPFCELGAMKSDEDAEEEAAEYYDEEDGVSEW